MKIYSNFVTIGAAGLIAVIGDVVWMTHDIQVNGFNWYYGVIMFLFLVSFVSSARILWNYHKEYQVKMKQAERDKGLLRGHLKGWYDY